MRDHMRDSSPHMTSLPAHHIHTGWTCGLSSPVIRGCNDPVALGLPDSNIQILVGLQLLFCPVALRLLYTSGYLGVQILDGLLLSYLK